MRVVYSEAFQAELCCVTGRYRTFDPHLAADFVHEVEQAVLSVREAPERWRLMDGRVRRRLVRRFPYIVYYLLDDDTLFFGTLLHTSRHPLTYL